MRIEELENNLYIKSTDTVEKFLLNIIQEYFRDSNTALEGSKEYIIKEAVDRLRTEMDYNSLGVLSITLPNGDVRKGDVTITLKDLDGEPLISPKLSAFNVDFGTEPNTACEGNDPRLSDARMPIAHQHEIQDINGLEGILSTILAQIERTEAYQHDHNNKDLLNKLRYTGSNSVIDLGIIDTLEPRVNAITEQIRTDITNYIYDTTTEIDDINQQLIEINRRIDQIQAFALEKASAALLEAKQYTDTKIQETTQEILDWIGDKYVEKNSITELIDIAKNCYTLVNTETWQLQNLLLQTDENTRTVNLPLRQPTLDEFSRRAIDLQSSTNIIFEFSLVYTKNNIQYKQPLPFVQDADSEFVNYLYPESQTLSIAGIIQNIQQTNNALRITFMLNEDQMDPDIVSTGKVTCDIFAKPLCPVYY